MHTDRHAAAPTITGEPARRVHRAGRHGAGRAALALGILFTLPGALHAAGREAQFAVGAVVLARTTIAAQAEAPFLEVTRADLARGYLVVPRATRLLLANTSPLGLVLDVWPTAPVFTAVDIQAGGAAATLSPDGGAITLRGVHGTAAELILDVRFALKPDLAPGRYPWPLRIGARPLLAP